MTVLILDDDMDTCTLFKMFFEKKGFDVLTANSLAEGMEIIVKNTPSMLFIDNYLPDGEGWKTAKAIKMKYPSININLMSAKDKSFNSLEDYSEFIWEKPISVEQLETYLQFMKRNNIS